MRKQQPIISVGMPVFNGEQYIAQAIKTVLDQTMGNFELIISDNASTDQTESICRKFAAQDDRIRYIRNSCNIGAARNYNQLFQQSVGKYFRWLNADDLCSPMTHEKCLAVMEAHPDAAMCYGKTDIINADGGLLEHYEDRLDLQQKSVTERFFKFWEVVGLTNAIYGLMRRSALEKTSLMGNGTFPAADINLMAELIMHGKFIEIPDTLFFRRMHEMASSWDRSNQSVQQQFWGGANSRFVMPTFRKEYSLWKAINSAPTSLSQRLRMKKYILRRIFWNRRAISIELRQAVAKKLTGTA